MNDQSLVLHPIAAGAWITGMLLLSGVFLIWREYNRTIRFRGLRIVAIIVALVAIAALILRPAFKTIKESYAILLTDGYKKEQADSVWKANSSAQFYHLKGATPYRKSKEIASVNDIYTFANDIRIVLGNGLSTTGWQQFSNAAIQYIPGETPTGITALYIPQSLFTNHEYTLHGVYNSQSMNAALILRSPAGVEDSVVLTKDDRHPFALSFTPRQAGNFIYQLTVKENNKTTTEDIPLVVHNDVPFKTLFLQQQPTFETQYLKSFLAHKNHHIVVRSQLSKNIYRHEYINHPAITIAALNQKTLSPFDLLIIDTESLQSLSASEVTALEDATENGLGILVLLQDVPNNRNVQHIIPLKISPSLTDTTFVTISGKQHVTLTVAPFTIASNPSLRVVLQNKRGILSGYRHKGLGKTGFQLLQSTYSLVLQGDSIDYSKIWSPVLEQIARTESVDNSVKITSTFPLYPQALINIEVITAGSNPRLQDDSTTLPLAEDARIDDRWEGTTWGRNPGWHTLTTADSTTHPYYISKENSWHSLDIAQRIETSRQHGLASQNTVTHSLPLLKPVPPFIFFLMLLIALTVLWVAPKL